MRKRLSIVGYILALAGLIFAIGGGVAYTKVQDGYDSLQAFSEAQNVTLSYNDDGQLIDRGSTEGADAIKSLLADDWGYPIVEGDLDPNDPLVNTGTEYMFQMATVGFHVMHGDQTITLTGDDITAAIESGQLDPDGTYNGVVEAYQGDVLEAGNYTVPVDGRYWTGFDRTDLLDGPARASAWTGTVHGLFGELGVGTVTHSALQLGLGMAALFGGLGLLFLAVGLGIVWASRAKDQVVVPDRLTDEIVDSVTSDQPVSI